MPRIRRTPEEARAEILRAASEVVREVGPAGLRIQEVARRAGMGHSTLLHHFGSRDALLKALTTRSLHTARESLLRGLVELASAQSEDLPGAIHGLFQRVQSDDFGRLVAWLMMSGHVGELELPDLNVIVEAMNQWRDVRFGLRDTSEDGFDTRAMLYHLAVIAVGESIAGEAIAKRLGIDFEDGGSPSYHRWFGENIVRGLELETATREDGE